MYLRIDPDRWRFSLETIFYFPKMKIMNFLNILLAILPTIVWLVFYYRKDLHPEPRRFVIKAFILGMAISIPVLLTQGAVGCVLGDKCVFNESGKELWPNMYLDTLVFLIVSVFIYAFLEEYFKYLAVKEFIIIKPYFDEPIDAMMYMIFTALGFATVENIIIGFSYDTFNKDLILILLGRFIGANLIHVVSSGIVGYFLARALLEHGKLYHSFVRHFYVDAGLILATLLHFLYNFFILIYNANSDVALAKYLYEKYFLVYLFLLIFLGYLTLSYYLKKLNYLSK